MDKYLASKINLWDFNVRQNSPGQRNRPDFIGIGIRIVDLCTGSALVCMDVAGLHDHAPKSKHIAAPVVGGVNAILFSAETKHRGPVFEGVSGLRVGMLKVDAEVVRLRAVSTERRQICIFVGWGDFLRIRFIWVHHCVEQAGGRRRRRVEWLGGVKEGWREGRKQGCRFQARAVGTGLRAATGGLPLYT